MTINGPNTTSVLAIVPFARGFGFVVFEGPDTLIEWGTKEGREDKTARSLEQVATLIAYYQPDVLVVEDYTDKSCWRRPRIRELIAAMLRVATHRGVRTRKFSRHAAKTVFLASGAQNKDEIAQVIAARFPELAPRRPPVRKPWMTEAEGMSVFDAAALGLTFFEREEPCP